MFFKRRRRLTSLAEVQDVLGRHLERFGASAQLRVNWSPPVPV